MFTNHQKMSIQISGKESRNGEKKWYTFEWGKGADQRKAAGIFTYTKPKDQIQKNHNKEALALLETKKSHLTIEHQATGTAFIPAHRFKDNFLDFYTEFVKNNARPGNRHLQGSLNQFKKFLRKSYLPPMEVTENRCTQFRTYLLDRLTGKTPADYFNAFKRVVKSATKEGYFRIHPAGDVEGKTNPSKRTKEFLEADEYISLINCPIRNKELRDAFILCCYQGLRWCDIENLSWAQIKNDVLVTKIIQKKTGKPVELTLHPISQQILKNRRESYEAANRDKHTRKTNTRELVFSLPTRNGANGVISNWAYRAKIKKYITWSSARLSFSILLQDANVDTATVALLLGHTTTRYVNETYKRFRPKNQAEHINKLPKHEWVYN
jgi:integrase